MPTRARRTVRATFDRFFRPEALGGVLLLAATLVALAWSNSRWSGTYFGIWDLKIGVPVGPLHLDKTLLHWINDGLMAVFFLMVGLEVKRELLIGEMSSTRRAALPLVAAIGGMVVPAAIYVAFTRGTPVASGWGIPMATDIAFALGALTILSSRLPPALAVFLAASAIVDDVGAVLVIALVYTPDIALVPLAVAAGALVALVAMNRGGVLRIWPYVLVGVVLWLAVLESGVHATVAGVVLAFTIPARKKEDPADSPLERVEHALLAPVRFAIVPLFALANAGVRFDASLVSGLLAPVGLGIVLGLVVGKQVGIFVAPWLAVRAGLAALPSGVGWRHIWGVGWLAGIGFTMALFITGLALPESELAQAKAAILVASVLSAVGGLVVLGTMRRGASV